VVTMEQLTRVEGWTIMKCPRWRHIDEKIQESKTPKLLIQADYNPSQKTSMIAGRLIMDGIQEFVEGLKICCGSKLELFNSSTSFLYYSQTFYL